MKFDDPSNKHSFRSCILLNKALELATEILELEQLIRINNLSLSTPTCITQNLLSQQPWLLQNVIQFMNGFAVF